MKCITMQYDAFCTLLMNPIATPSVPSEIDRSSSSVQQNLFLHLFYTFPFVFLILQASYYSKMALPLYSSVSRTSSTLSPISVVELSPPRSFVRMPNPPASLSSKTFFTASSTAFAYFSRPRE